MNSPMPTPESAAAGVYCEAGCHEIKPKYAIPGSAMPGSAKIGTRGRKSARPEALGGGGAPEAAPDLSMAPFTFRAEQFVPRSTRVGRTAPAS